MSKYDKYIGQVMDERYRLERFIGIGGMAVVFEATDLQDNSIVALKILREEIASDMTSVKRFINESKAVAMFNHPNIVKIFDVHVRGKHKYIVMERIEGITLRSYMDTRGALSFKTTCAITEQILLALEHAHEKGIIHRDIKPQNIMLQKSGRVIVTDFGIAKLPNAETVTMTDKAIGTVFYISPEQARGKEIDTRSDLYSLGILMYEMITGQLPFKAETPVGVALMQINDAPVPPHELMPTMPRGLEQIILEAILKDPDYRIQTATDMLYYLRQLSADPFTVFSFQEQSLDGTTTALEQVAPVAQNKFIGWLAKPSRKPQNNENLSFRDKYFRSKGESATMMPIILAICLAFLVVSLIAVFYFMTALLNDSVFDILRPSQENRTMVVGDYRGEEFTYFLYEELQNQGYNVTRHFVYHNSVEPNFIVSQSPMPNENRIRGSFELELFISRGADATAIENFIMLDYRNVQLDLQRRDFVVRIERVDNQAIPNGMIIATRPAPGMPLNQYNGEVTLVVSRGPSISLISSMPTFRELKEYDALALLSQYGLRVGEVTHEFSNTYAPGTIIWQYPAAGAPNVPRGTFVDFRIAYGQQLTSPQLFGLTREQAIARIQEAGLNVGTVTYQATTELQPNRVISQTPDAGSVVVSGDYINIVISRAPELPPDDGNDDGEEV